ncbi:MAG: hypothetical protein WCC92_14075 [Candidatus Korobacteraceae bacterium]
MPESVIETEGESPKRRALHVVLKGLAFVPNLVFAAIAGALLAAPISLLLFHIFPSGIAAYIQDVTTLLPAFGLGYLVARKFEHSVARWIWVPALALWLLVVLPDVASYTGQNCELSRSQYFLHEFVVDIRTSCDEGLAWPLYTLPTLCCVGYSLGARLAAKGKDTRLAIAPKS